MARAPPVNYDGLKPPTVILVTDIHGDHLDPSAIATLKGPRTTVLVPAVPGWQWFESATPIASGQTRAIDGVSVLAVPMYNLQRGPSAGQLFHTKGRGNGYVIAIGGTRVYVAGDTECTPEMRALKNIDVAFLPMNLPYTMTPAEAAACAKAFTPRIVYPYHYRGQDVRAFEAALRDSGIDVRSRDWYVGALPVR
jgi:L-ascorbate metabolism protein UlaG (beta-lactamase superfamily)